MCMCMGGAQGYGTTCRWCGIGNGVPDNFARQLAIELVKVQRENALHSKEMRRIHGDKWDEERWTVNPK